MSKFLGSGQSRTVERSMVVVGQGYNTRRNYNKVYNECFPSLGLLSWTHS